MEASKRVVSLWDMLSFNTSAFYKAVSSLRHGQVVTRGFSNETKALAISGISLEQTSLALNDLISALGVLGAKVASISAERLRSRLAGSGVTYDEYATAFLHIDRVMRDELSLSSLYALDPGKERYLDPAALLMGQEVNDKFASAAFDISEAAQCLAFGRDTAAVFHLMRVMEVGLKAVHACLGLPMPSVGSDRNWGKMLSAIRTNYKGRQHFPERDLFQELFVLLDSVKDAWRNSTMHVENKYTTEEAERILFVVGGFMQKLASRMDEAGQPRA